MSKGVMFDFSGTLMRIEPTERWLTAGLEQTGTRLDEGTGLTEWVRRLDEYGAVPGGDSPQRMPAGVQALWDERDLTAEQHRATYTGLTRAAGLTDSRLVDALYDRHMTPAAWQPYPDALPVLRELRGRGVPAVVVSNIGWDLRPVLRAHGFDEYVDGYVLSYEVGVQKPDPGIFTTACERLGLPPAEVLMVGDSREADGGAAALGCAVHYVDHLPVDRRPTAQRPVLDMVG
jgi:putative hydrolase of the HAD superfamily